MKISEMNCPPLLNEIKVLKNKIKKMKTKNKILNNESDEPFEIKCSVLLNGSG